MTGAASGIGRATAERLLAEGATVVGTDVRPPRWRRRTGPTATVPTVDVSDEAGMAAAVAQAVDAGGRLDGVVHAAGVAGGGPVHLLDLDEWDRVIASTSPARSSWPRPPSRQMLDQPAADGERGVARHARQHRGPRGHRGRQRLQRVQGRRRPAHEEHGHRLRAVGHPGQRDLPGLRRHADDRVHLRHGRHGGGGRRLPRRAHARAASGRPTRSRPRPRTCCPTTPRSCPAPPSPSTAGTPPGATTGSRG